MLWLLLACFQENDGAAGPGAGPGGAPPAEAPGEPPPPGEGPQPMPFSANPGNSTLTWTIDGTEHRSEGFRVETDAKGESFRGAVHMENGEKLEFEIAEVVAGEAGSVATVTFEVADSEHEVAVPMTVTPVDGGLDIVVDAPVEVDGTSVQVSAALSFRSDEGGEPQGPPGTPPPKGE